MQLARVSDGRCEKVSPARLACMRRKETPMRRRSRCRRGRCLQTSLQGCWIQCSLRERFYRDQHCNCKVTDVDATSRSSHAPLDAQTYGRFAIDLPEAFEQSSCCKLSLSRTITFCAVSTECSTSCKPPFDAHPAANKLSCVHLIALALSRSTVARGTNGTHIHTIPC